MAQFIYVLRPTRLAMLSEGPNEAEQQALAAHFEYLQGLAARGLALLFGRTQTDGAETFGIVIFEAPEPEQARSLMLADPAVSQGVMTAELFPYQVAGGRLVETN